jgi:hypothetical protein
MYRELRDSIVICRQPHECGWCAEKIDKGERAHFRSYVWSGRPGEIVSDWMHPECWNAMIEQEYDPEDGWMPGDYRRGSNEPA